MKQKHKRERTDALSHSLLEGQRLPPRHDHLLARTVDMFVVERLDTA